MAGKRAPKTSANHSIRCPNIVWEKARRRARMEGHTMNYVLNEILEGYGNGFIDLPKIVKKYGTPGRGE